MINKINIKVTRKDGYYLEDLDSILNNNKITDINISQATWITDNFNEIAKIISEINTAGTIKSKFIWIRCNANVLPKPTC